MRGEQLDDGAQLAFQFGTFFHQSRLVQMSEQLASPRRTPAGRRPSL